MLVYALSTNGITTFYLSDILTAYAHIHNITTEMAHKILTTYSLSHVGNFSISGSVTREETDYYLINPQLEKDILKQYQESLQ